MNPATLAAVRRYVTWANTRRATALVCALLIAQAAYIFHTSQHKSAAPICGVALPYDPFAVRAFRLADRTGSVLARILYGPPPSNDTIKLYVDGTLDVLRWEAISVLNPIRGFEHFAGLDRGDVGVNPYTIAQPCIPPEEACTETPPPGSSEPPWDPKNAALGTDHGTVITGAGIHAVAQAASKYWTGRELQTAVAIAGAESSYRPTTGPTVRGGTMRGLWQINDGAHPQLFSHGENWRDPAVNAAMAHDVWKRAGNSWAPWSTYTSGAYRSHMAEAAAAIPAGAGGGFAAISNSPAKPPVQPTPPSGTIPLGPVTGSVAAPTQPPAPQSTPSPAPECVPATPSTGGGPDTVGTWNIWYRNSAANVNAGAGFADLTCLNELRSQRVRVPGYQVSPFSSAVEIIWKTSKLDRLEVHRTTTLTGYARDKSLVHGVWKSRTTGKSFAALCGHQLVQGGSGWAKQAANVNRIRASYERRGLPVILLGDMNAGAGKVAAAFGGQHDCVRIICAVTYGIKPAHTETLSKMGSDHPRVRYTFPTVGKSDSPTSAAPAANPPEPAAGAVPTDFDQQGNPRTVEQAIAWMHAAMPNGSGGEPVSNRCERYMNLAYGLGGGYATANAHWNAAGPKGQGVPPRGALVFWRTSNSAGHVALSVGGGRVISTDFDGTNFRSGVIGEGPIEALDKWGPRLGWRAPNFNVGSGK